MELVGVAAWPRLFPPPPWKRSGTFGRVDRLQPGTLATGGLRVGDMSGWAMDFRSGKAGTAATPGPGTSSHAATPRYYESRGLGVEVMDIAPRHPGTMDTTHAGHYRPGWR